MRTVVFAAMLVAVMVGCVRVADGQLVNNGGEGGGQREIVAVFNFAQRDDNPKYAWLSKGLADLLINQLTDLPQISVVSRDRMQLLISEYESVLNKSLKESRPEMRMAGETLSAKRVVFGTYGVSGDEVTLTLQVSDVNDEAVLFQSQVKGKYSEALNLERELARRLRAYFLGQATEKVPLADVPQWTSQVGSAEHLYAGVDQFDKGNYAEAWLRFRLAAKADADYADAVYWQGRMFYYLALYENARPLLNDFFNRWPHHPRASDAAIELLDSWRQTMNDPAALGQACLALRERVDRQTLIYNKALPGQESHSLLRSYIGGFAVQSLRQQHQYTAAARLAEDMLWESCLASRRQDFQGTAEEKYDAWRGYGNLSYLTAVEAATWDDELVVESRQFGRYPVSNFVTLEHPQFVVRGRATDFMQPKYVQHGDKYIMTQGYSWDYVVLAPEGYCLASTSIEVTPHHEGKTPPYQIRIFPSGVSGDIGIYRFSTGQGVQTREIPTPHRCRFLLFAGDYDFGNDGGAFVVQVPSTDYIEKIRFIFTFEPLPPDDCQIRLILGNQTNVKVYLDGRPTINDDGLIRGVKPGRHVITVAPQNNSHQPSWLLKPVEQEVVVGDKGVTECTIVPPFNEKSLPPGWRNTVTLARDYPLASVPPPMGTEGFIKSASPALLRVQRGTRRGQLVALWPFRENLWLAYSQDDGGHWTATERLPIPVDTAHNQISPQLIQDEQGRFCLAFISDRGIERAHYPYVCWSDDLSTWSAPLRVAPVVADKARFLQDKNGRYLLLLPPIWRPDDVGWRIKQDNGRVGTYERTELTKAMQQRYGRRKPVLLTSTDLVHWSELETNLGTPQLRDADITQTADGRFHAVFTQQPDQQPDGKSHWFVEYQTSPDAAHWGPLTTLREGTSWPLTNPQITTDGREILGTIGDTMFRIGSSETFFWSGFVGGRNVPYFDPPGFGSRLHWLWLRDDSRDNPIGEGELYYTSCDGAGSQDWYDRMISKQTEALAEKKKQEARSDGKAGR